MQRLNNAPILDQTEGMRDRLLMIALWKANGGKMVNITVDDMKQFMAAFGGMPVLFTHGHKDSIEIGIVDVAKAAQLAAHQDNITPKGTH